MNSTLAASKGRIALGNPTVHILYYRPIQPGFIEILRVLHQRMEPSRHLAAASSSPA
jgi:toxin ParE1/3/4